MHFDPWAPVIVVVVGWLVAEILSRWSRRRTNRKLAAIDHERATLETDLTEWKAKRAALLETLKQNTLVFVRGPNRAWRKWSKPGVRRIYSRP